MNRPSRRLLRTTATATAPALAGMATASRARRALPWIAAAATTAVAAAIVRNRSRKAERENPPIGKFVEVDGVWLHYVERGQGEPLVLLHGNTVMGLDFLLSDLVEMAASKYRVIIFDRPGYGHSERPRQGPNWDPEEQARLFAHALPKIGIDRAIVLGHSWGATLAVAMGLNHPSCVRALVLEAGYYYPTIRFEVPLTSLPAVPVVGDFFSHTYSALLFRAQWPLIIKALFAPAPVPDSFKSFPVWMAARPSQLRAAGAEHAQVVPSAMSMSQRYHQLSVPTVLIHGTGDKVVSHDAHSKRLHAELPESRLITVDGMGHMLHHLVPARVMDAIDAAADMAPTDASQGTPATVRLRPAPQLVQGVS